VRGLRALSLISLQSLLSQLSLPPLSFWTGSSVSKSLAPVIDYIDQQYQEYMTAERHPGFRKVIPDTRVHAVLYFIAPTGHG